MLKSYLAKYNDDIKDCKNWLKNIKTWYKLIPNILTLSRPIGMIPANILFFSGSPLAAVILTSLLLLTDLFDGKLARKWNVQSKLGADLDAVGDKVMFLGMALPLIVSNPIMLLSISFEGAIAFVNVVGRLKGLDTKTVYSGKVKTCFLSLTLGIGYLVEFFNVPVSILHKLVALTAVSQGIALTDYVGKYKEMELENKYKTMENKYQEINCQKEDVVSDKVYERVISLGNVSVQTKYTGKRRVRKLMHDKRNRF